MIVGSGDFSGAPFAVGCRIPDCHGNIWALSHMRFDTKAEAIAAWNTRAAPSAPRVRALVWNRGMIDWAKPLPGMKYVACSTMPKGSWAWWLDGADETRGVFPDEIAAKAAAQADYTARILAALDIGEAE